MVRVREEPNGSERAAIGVVEEAGARVEDVRGASKGVDGSPRLKILSIVLAR